MSAAPALVVHVPHASLAIPDDVAATLLLRGDALARELLAMTDRYTDELFAFAAPEAARVVFPVSRLVVDPERFERDADEPMAARGMGAVYERTSDGRALREPPSPAARAGLLGRFYRPHHAALEAAVAAALDAHGRCLVLDAHSFPSAPLPYEDDQDPARPDVCIGTDAFHTPARLRDEAVAAFRSEGLVVAVDRPFAGALVPAAHFRREPRVAALMIELNRRLYMHEATGARSADFDAIAHVLRRAILRLAPA